MRSWRPSETNVYAAYAGFDRGVYPPSFGRGRVKQQLWRCYGGTPADHVSFTYDRLGRKVTSTDQRGVVHTYTYHGNGTAGDAGRLCYDTVTDFGSSDADQRIRRFYYERNDVGQANGIRSYTYDGSYHVADAIAQSFNDWGMPKSQWQDHDDIDDAWIDAIKIMSTYEDGAASGEAKYVRLDYVSYLECDGTPDARDIYYNYGSTGGTSDVLSRLDNLANNGSGTTKYAEYSYLGAGTIAKVAHPAVTGGLNLVYDPDGNDSFTGWDRFGRVVDQRWQNSTPVVKDQFEYGYDRASNRTWREVAPDGGNPTGFDEYYTYDGLDRLEKAERGTLAGTPYSSIMSHTKRQDFGLEALGNWREFKDDAGDGSTWDLDQDRTHNAVNEISGITGGSWIVPGYDAAGNMLSGPKPGNETVRQHYKWDAWNRMVAVYADDNNEPGDLIEEYRYDALNRRIAKIKPDPEHEGKYVRRDFYYTPSWQIAQTRENNNLNDKETLATTRKYEYVWDIRYIDAPVCRDKNTDDDNLCDDEHLYFTNDANMNVTGLVDASDGSVVERVTYDPYGKPKFYDGSWANPSDTSAFDNAILYCGYYFNPESGLYDVRRRPYNFALGRWPSRDPSDEPYGDGMNLCEYVGSNPTIWVDPFGLESVLEALEKDAKENPNGTAKKVLDQIAELSKGDKDPLGGGRVPGETKVVEPKTGGAQEVVDALNANQKCTVVLFMGHWEKDLEKTFNDPQSGLKKRPQPGWKNPNTGQRQTTNTPDTTRFGAVTCSPRDWNEQVQDKGYSLLPEAPGSRRGTYYEPGKKDLLKLLESARDACRRMRSDERCECKCTIIIIFGASMEYSDE